MKRGEAGEERKALGRMRVRIERGAVEPSARYYFDARLGMVRGTAKVGTA